MYLTRNSRNMSSKPTFDASHTLPYLSNYFQWCRILLNFTVPQMLKKLSIIARSPDTLHDAYKSSAFKHKWGKFSSVTWLTPYLAPVYANIYQIVSLILVSRPDCCINISYPLGSVLVPHYPLLSDHSRIRCGRQSVGGIATRYGVRRSGVRTPMETRFSAPIQTGLEAQIGYRGSVLGVKWPGRGINHLAL